MAVARAQAPLGNFSTAAGTTIAKAITLTAGNAVAVGVLWSSSSATMSVADTLGNTYTVQATSLATNATSGNRAQFAVATNVTGGATTITATISGSVGERDLFIHELSGADTTTAFDSGIGANANAANPSTSLTTVTAGGIVGIVLVPVGTATVGATYTSGVAQNGNLSEDKFGTFTGAQTVAFVDASSSQYVLSAVGIKASAGGGGGVTVKQLAALGVG